MYQFFGTFFAGAAAALLMAGMFAMGRNITHTKMDMIRSIGTLFTKRFPFTAGMLVHLVLGGLFAFGYVSVWSYLGFPMNNWALAFGAMMGLAHGFVASFWMVIFVAEHHPIGKFRGPRGFASALFDIGGHVVYGALLAAFIVTLQLKYQWIADTAKKDGVVAVSDLIDRKLDGNYFKEF